MVLTASTMLPLGTSAPDFSLPDTHGKMVSLKDFQDKPVLLVMFICNHCPYVKHIQPRLVPFCKELQDRGVGVVAINSNDASQYPDDSPENMAKVAKQLGYTFPYLYDEQQKVAKEYAAACTPDFYVFDSARRLVYRGQFDDSRPGNGVPVTGKDLWDAIDALLTGRTVSLKQKPSMGCNIKWKPGNEPSYFAH
ncbi:MAG TPA: thioredoxin family protein [Candidatus Hydrogenedentes bacterium]|nr:thioredoxin family protein [Candidatus Hydrogenedentota bacterium]HOL78017.1 thioredoxin family protein [Candidatus Hydrogenedentota bacterium]HPO87063.1 thioredoxin family protein [Candidatus Hydrogenedentota bacterium]